MTALYCVHYATSSDVYKSTDAGSSFTRLTSSPGGAGSQNIEITAIDVTTLGSHHIVMVGTSDTDSTQYGGVYILDESESSANWTDTNLGNYDVYAVAFSPNFAADGQLVAVVTDEVDTLVTTTNDTGWGQTMGDAIIEGITPSSAAIAFPSDYDGEVTADDCFLFIAIDTGSDDGDVYAIEGREAPDSSIANDLDIGSAYNLSNVDGTSLAIDGNATTANILAGTADSAEVYFSSDGGSNWTRSIKPPTGRTRTYVLIAPDFSSHGGAYAATSGTESALSYTTDGGVTWNQVGLIDTKISEIIDLAPSPDYNQDDTLFMLTWGGKHSLWRSLNDGTDWERVFTSALPNVDQIDWVELSPNYSDSQVVFVAGVGNGDPIVWRSTDNGQEFKPQSAPSPIDAWAIAGDDTLFIGSYDGSNGIVYSTTDSGLSYSTQATAGSQPLHSIALSPDYDEDETILVGNTNGWAYWSSDNGNSFEPLPPQVISPPLTGSITVAFDPRFSRNNTAYAASDTPDIGIYRFIIDASTSWESIDSTLPEGSMFSQLKVAANGTLYATSFKTNGGMERCLNPTDSPGPTFETVTSGLDEGATLMKIWLSDHSLWSIDTTNDKLLTFIDSLAVPVTLTSPPDQASDIGTMVSQLVSNVSLDWETLSGATSYQWQIDDGIDFSSLPEEFEGNTKASSVRLPALEPTTTYYWRVRATKPLLSPWSAKWSFTTSPGTEMAAPILKRPERGASDVPIKPLFEWSAIAGADSYELLVSTDTSLVNRLIAKVGDYALPETAWQCDLNLDYDTTYYWKVRARSTDAYSAWSAIGTFTTQSPPLLTEPVESLPSPPPPQPTPPPYPPPPAQPAVLDWAIYLMGFMGLIIVSLLITTILLMIKQRNLGRE